VTHGHMNSQVLLGSERLATLITNKHHSCSSTTSCVLYVGTLVVVCTVSGVDK